MRNIFTLYFCDVGYERFLLGAMVQPYTIKQLPNGKNPGKYHPNEQLHCF